MNLALDVDTRDGSVTKNYLKNETKSKEDLFNQNQISISTSLFFLLFSFLANQSIPTMKVCLSAL